jgi:hypothetical protein
VLYFTTLYCTVLYVTVQHFALYCAAVRILYTFLSLSFPLTQSSCHAAQSALLSRNTFISHSSSKHGTALQCTAPHRSLTLGQPLRRVHLCLCGIPQRVPPVWLLGWCPPPQSFTGLRSGGGWKRNEGSGRETTGRGERGRRYAGVEQLIEVLRSKTI